MMASLQSCFYSEQIGSEVRIEFYAKLVFSLIVSARLCV